MNLELLMSELLCHYFSEPAQAQTPFPLPERECRQDLLAELCGLPTSWSGLDAVRPLLESIGNGLVKWDGQRSRNRPHITAVVEDVRRDGFTLEEALTDALAEFFRTRD